MFSLAEHAIQVGFKLVEKYEFLKQRRKGENEDDFFHQGKVDVNYFENSYILWEISHKLQEGKFELICLKCDISAG